MIYYRPDLRQKSRILRKNMTPQEKHLWYDFLKSYQPQFYRQKPMLDYILDFYCPKARVAIELDGSQHYEEAARAYDDKRTRALKAVGIDIVRYTNRQISESFEAVCLSIDNVIKSALLQSD